MDEERGKTCNRVMLKYGLLVLFKPGLSQKSLWLTVMQHEGLTSAEIPPIPPTARRPSLYWSGTRRLKTVSILKAGSSTGRPCIVNHRHGLLYVG